MTPSCLGRRPCPRSLLSAIGGKNSTIIAITASIIGRNSRMFKKSNRITTPKFDTKVPSEDDLRRIENVLRTVGGKHVAWGAKEVLNLWLLEQREAQEVKIANRMLVSSWCLVAATIALVLATAGMAVAALL